MKPGKTYIVMERALKEAAVAFYQAEAAFAASGGKGLSTNYRHNLERLGDVAAAFAQAALGIEARTEGS